MRQIGFIPQVSKHHRLWELPSVSHNVNKGGYKLDWNWFFSTLSQSTAAIVGIVGAFIIAKIFSNQTVFSDKNNKMKALDIESKKVLDRIGTIDFEWYNRVVNEAALREAADEIDKIDSEDPAYYSDELLESIYSKAEFSEFTEKEQVMAKLRSEAQEQRDFLKEKRLREERRQNAQDKMSQGGLNTLMGLQNLVGDLAPSMRKKRRVTDLTTLVGTPWPSVTKERELITSCFLDSKHHSRVVGDFLSSVKGNPESPSQITWSLVLVGLLFLAGVIYPLTFMPSEVGLQPTHSADFEAFNAALFSIKGGLLTLLAVAFLSIVGMFICTNLRMRYDTAKIANLERLSNIYNYCPYFVYLGDGEQVDDNKDSE